MIKVWRIIFYRVLRFSARCEPAQIKGAWLAGYAESRHDDLISANPGSL